MTPNTSDTYGVVQYLGCFNDSRVTKDEVSRSIFERDKIPYWSNYGLFTGDSDSINAECSFFSYDEGEKCQWTDPRLEFTRFGSKFSHDSTIVS